MSSCGQCKDPVRDKKEEIKCVSCSNFFHYYCAEIREKVFVKMTGEAKLKWACLKCKNIKSGQKTVTKGGDDLNESSQFKGFNFSEIMESVDKKLSLISGIKVDISMLQKTTDEIQKSQQALSDWYDEMDNKLKCLPGLEKEINGLRSLLVEKDKQICELSLKVEKLEQYGRNKNLEINEVAEQEEEKIENVVIKVAEKMGISLKEEDIEAAHRLPKTRTESRPATIIVQFARRKKRDEMLQARKTVVTNADTTGLPGGRIYVGENLSYYFRNLLKKAKAKAKPLNYAFIWFKNGVVRVRKTNDSKVVLIESERDLAKIK